jgi:AcrR family transcriptional regulator
MNGIVRGRPKTFNNSEVINYAMYNYWGKGVNKVSINEICRKCKVSKPSLYREFGGEDGLMKETVLLYKRKIVEPLLKVLENRNTFRASLYKIISIFTRSQNKNDMPKGCLLVKLNESSSEVGKETRNAINQTKRHMLKSFENWINISKDKGEISKKISSKLVASYIDVQFDNALSMLIKNKDKNTVKRFLLLALSPLMSKRF